MAAQPTITVHIDQAMFDEFRQRMETATEAAIQQICGTVWNEWQQLKGVPNGLVVIDPAFDPYADLPTYGFEIPPLDEAQLRDAVRTVWDKLKNGV